MESDEVIPQLDGEGAADGTAELREPRQAVGDLSVPRFCTTCGTGVIHGRCPTCDARPKRDRRHLPQAAILLIAAAPGLAALVVGPRLLDSRTEELQTRVEALAKTNEELARSLAARTEKTDGLLARIGALESTAENQPDTAATVARVQGSVFTVTAGPFSGSAWVVHQQGTTSRLITNYHVVSDVWKDGDKHVVLRAGTEQWDGVVLDVSEGTDLAVIEVQASFPVLERADGMPSVGDPVLAFGSPLGLDDSVSTGIVSAIRTEGFDDYIQFSAPVSPGSSGGPLVNTTGLVVGMTVMKAVSSGAEGLGFAIPIGVVCDVVTC